MWWLYFDYAAAIAQRRLELAENRTQMARDAYTYLHVVMVAGVIVAAVGDELVIAHPDEVLHGAELVAVGRRPGDLPAARRSSSACGWRARSAASGSPARSRASPRSALGTSVSALALATVLLAILVAVIAAEQISGAPPAARGRAVAARAAHAARPGSAPARPAP